MWSSFESICNIGEKIDPNKYFTVNSALNAYKAQIFDTNLFLNQQQHQHQQQLNQQIQQHQQQLTQQQQQQQYQSNNHQQQQPPPPQSNVLKQIDQQNEMMLDSKNKQDIAHILRMVEADQQNKLNTIKQQQSRVSLSSHHPNCCFHSKENSLGNESTSEQQTQQQPQSSSSGQEQELQICSCQSFTNESIHETSNTNDSSNTSFQKLSKQTPLLNQV
jgi:hypothetical protein